MNVIAECVGVPSEWKHCQIATMIFLYASDPVLLDGSIVEVFPKEQHDNGRLQQILEQYKDSAPVALSTRGYHEVIPLTTYMNDIVYDIKPECTIIIDDQPISSNRFTRRTPLLMELALSSYIQVQPRDASYIHLYTRAYVTPSDTAFAFLHRCRRGPFRTANDIAYLDGKVYDIEHLGARASFAIRCIRRWFRHLIKYVY